MLLHRRASARSRESGHGRLVVACPDVGVAAGDKNRAAQAELCTPRRAATAGQPAAVTGYHGGYRRQRATAPCEGPPPRAR